MSKENFAGNLSVVKNGESTTSFATLKQWQESLQMSVGGDAFFSPEILQREWDRLEGVATASTVEPPKPIEALSSIAVEVLPLVHSSTENLEAIRNDLGDCKRCKLAGQRTHLVFGEGNPNAQIMFVGEGPGEQEDLQGRPFVGNAGQLLDKIIEAMGYARADVYIANVVKCRPPQNRTPEPDETSTCEPFLLRQIAAISPQVLIALGGTALKSFLGPDVRITQQRGVWQKWNGISLMPTYHPSYLLRNPSAKKEVWDDMKQVLAFLKTNSN